ncbi:MAG: YeeE/YedE family protein [Saprospiraceae bacterium]|nr:YeeE/YedE family protein [Saprospiraceae bacterium]
MIILFALFIGFAYGYASVKGQFCMNSGFSNVMRRNDSTKLKSFVAAILIQMLILPLLLTVLYLYNSTNYLVEPLCLPPLFLAGSATGGFLFGVFMHYAAGCGAGIFYKIGENNSGSVIAVMGFIAGIYVAEKGVLKPIKELSQNIILLDQQPIWKGNSPLIVSAFTGIMAAVALYLLFKQVDQKPGGALWGWKKTGIAVGIIGIIGWLSALLATTSYGMSIIPGVTDLFNLQYSWGLLFLTGIPLGAFWSARGNKSKRFSIPKPGIIYKRLIGGLGLGVSGSIAAGCTVGHGLTFAPLLGVGSLVATMSIFLGSGLVGYLTRK